MAPDQADSTPLDILAGVNYTNENYPQIAPVSAPPEVRTSPARTYPQISLKDFSEHQ